ncbi:MAG: ATP-binding protein [Myxococcota bacterium]|nr:ATP-binding protein [Myxococcota bacterium]
MRPARLPTVRQLLLALNAFVLLLPLLLLFGLRVYDAALVQQTERRLIGESVLVAEAWRDGYTAALGLPTAGAAGARPPHARDAVYAPIDPATAADFEVLPPAPEAQRTVAPGEDAPWEAGRAITPLLLRAKVFNLSGARVVDASGCVVATSGTDLGACLDHLPEVRSALAGRYAAVVRQRISDEPEPPLSSIRRRGEHRVFAATPVWHDGRVIGAVRMSRTAVAPEEWLWGNRDRMLGLALACAVVLPLISYSISHAISRPLRDITAAAHSVAVGESDRDLAPRRLAAREIFSLADALERMRDSLESRARFIASFTTDLGHELKTPVTAIRGAAELLHDGWDAMDPAQRERFLANLEGDARRLEGLVRELLTLARIEHTPEPGDRVVVVSFFESLLERYGDEVTLEVRAAPVEVAMSRERLESAVRNLVENALRHGRGKGVQVEVSEDAGRLRVRVRDGGPGIPQVHRDRVFDRFFTTARESGGTGLGLSIVRAVVESRSGRLELDTGPDGTTVTLWL